MLVSLLTLHLTQVAMADGFGAGSLPLSEIGLPNSQMIKLLNADFNTTEDVKDLQPSEMSQGRDYIYNLLNIHDYFYNFFWFEMQTA